MLSKCSLPRSVTAGSAFAPPSALLRPTNTRYWYSAAGPYIGSTTSRLRCYRTGSSGLCRESAESTAAPRLQPEKPPTDGERQKFYDRFLNKRIKFRSPAEETGAWITALDPVPLRSSLPSSLLTNPLEVFEDTTVSPEVATQCLAVYVSSLHRRIADKKAARSVYSADQAGTKALR